MLSYDDLENRWKTLGQAQVVRLHAVACGGAGPELLLAEIGDSSAPAIALSAGVHGDEPAAVWALLSIIEDLLLPSCFAYRIWPCTNPSGYRLGTRANAEGKDVNRTFGGTGRTPESRAIIAANTNCSFVLSLDLHEDADADGFYCYERWWPGLQPIGQAIVEAMDEAKLPVQHVSAAYDLGYALPAEHMMLERGRVVPDVKEESNLFAESCPYSLYMIATAAQRTLTVESPTKLDWETRIAIHRVAVTTAIACLV